MIATIDDIRSVRDISRNIGRDRIEPYILEVEHAYIVPAIGAELYERIDAGDEEDSTLIYGGYYSAGSIRKMCYGLKKAIAYYAYERILRNNPINVTAFGVTQKTGNFSQPTSQDVSSPAIDEARKMADLYLQSCVDYINRNQECNEQKPERPMFIQVLK